MLPNALHSWVPSFPFGTGHVQNWTISGPYSSSAFLSPLYGGGQSSLSYPVPLLKAPNPGGPAGTTFLEEDC